MISGTLLAKISVCISEYFYLSTPASLSKFYKIILCATARKNTHQYYTPQRLIKYMYCGFLLCLLSDKVN